MAPTESSYFDLISEEALSHIIYFVVADDRAFWLDQAFRQRPAKCKEDAETTEGDADGDAPMEIHYRHTGQLVRYRTHLPPDQEQSQHIADWLFVNSTSARIRRHGKAVLFDAKPVAATSALVDRLRAGACPSLSAADQALALARTRVLVLVDNRCQTSTTLVKLPARAHAFPRLRRCHLLFDLRGAKSYPLARVWAAEPRVREAEMTTVSAAPAAESSDFATYRTQGTPRLLRRLRDLLVRTGFPAHVAVDVSEGPVGWACTAQALREDILPFLEAKAVLMERMGRGGVV